MARDEHVRFAYFDLALSTARSYAESELLLLRKINASITLFQRHALDTTAKITMSCWGRMWRPQVDVGAVEKALFLNLVMETLAQDSLTRQAKSTCGCHPPPHLFLLY